MRLHPGWRILIYLFGCLLCLVFCRQILNLLGLREPYLAGLIAITAATWLMLKFFQHGRLRDLGLTMRRRTPADLALGVCLPLGLLAGIFVLEWLAGWLLVVGGRMPTLGLLLVLCWRFAAVAFYEELFARGYLLQTLAGLCRPLTANVLSALIFAGLHGLNPNVSIPALLGVFLAGLLLGLCYQVTRSLYLPMAFHFAWNTQQALLGFPVSGTAQPGLLKLLREGPVLLTGGAFGPEAGLLGFAAIVLAAVLVGLYGRRGLRAHAS